MPLRQSLAWIALLLCLVPRVCLAAARPAPPSAERSLADSLLLVQNGHFEDALLPLRHLYTAPVRQSLSPQWRKRLPFLLGYVYFRTGDYKKAALHLEGARGTYPELQDYTLWLLGESLLNLGRMPQAHAALRRLLETFPDSLHRSEALFKTAEASRLMGDLPRALQLYSLYHQEYPETPRHSEVHLGLGMVQRDMGNPEGALREWRHVWLEHPEDAAAAKVPDLERTLPGGLLLPAIGAESLFRRADRLYRLNRHREAVQAYALARAATPDEAISDERLSQLGMALYHARDNPAAVATFRQLLERAPRGQLAPAALFMLARLHLRVEADDLFLATEKTLTTQFPGSKQAEEARYLVGHFHRNRGRTAEAKRVFQQVAQQGKGGEFADNAMWYLGWMQYGAGEHAQAAATWGKLLTTVPGSPLVPDALYWLGRALERLGRQGDARARFERLRASYGQTYYGYLAAARLSGSSAWAWDARGSEGPVTDLTGRIANAALQDPPSPGAANPHAVRGAELWAMRLWAEAGEELQAVPTDQGKALSSQWRAAQAFHWAGDHHRAMAIVRRYGKGALQQAVGISPEDLQEMTFPLGALQRLHGASLAGLDPLFVGALVMAESHWNPRALSPVGARGLMQLMPDTGRRVAQGIGVDLASDDQLFDALLNLRLGISHLRELLLRFDQLLPLAAASYNAGEEEVAKWWARRGEMDIEEFVANIPFRETRQYVQRVFVFYTTYQRIYRGLPG